jgi:hypothetical protein
MVFSVSVGVYVVYNKIWDAGYGTAQVEYRAKEMRAIRAAVAQAKIEWELSARIAAVLMDKERRTNKEIHDVINQIPGAVSSSSCTAIGPAALRLYNAAITGGDATTTGSATSGMP